IKQAGLGEQKRRSASRAETPCFGRHFSQPARERGVAGEPACDPADDEHGIAFASHFGESLLGEKGKDAAFAFDGAALRAGHDLDRVDRLAGESIHRFEHLKRTDQIELVHGRHNRHDDSAVPLRCSAHTPHYAASAPRDAREATRSSRDMSSRLSPDFTIRRACARVADGRAPWRIRGDSGRKLTRSLAYDVPREGPAMGAISKDILAALRQFRRRPRFTWAVAITLALSIGANVAVFSVVNAVLLRALPFSNPERLVWIASVRSDNPSAPFTLPEYIDYRGQT